MILLGSSKFYKTACTCTGFTVVQVRQSGSTILNSASFKVKEINEKNNVSDIMQFDSIELKKKVLRSNLS